MVNKVTGVMVSSIFHRKKENGTRPRSVLIWAATIGLLFGLLEAGLPLEDAAQMARNKARAHEASGQVVVAGIDSIAFNEVGAWPWSNRAIANLITDLRARGASRIFIDTQIPGARSPRDRQALIDALAAARGRVYLPTNFSFQDEGKLQNADPPAPDLQPLVETFNSNAEYNAFSRVWTLPQAMRIDGVIVPSLSAAIANRPGRPGDSYMVDYSVEFGSIPYVSVADIMGDEPIGVDLAGKDVVIAPNAASLGWKAVYPGQGPLSQTFVHVAGAETLKNRETVRISWLIPLAISALFGMFVLFLRNSLAAWLTFGTGVASLVFGPILFESFGIFTQIMPALVLLLICGGGRGWMIQKERFRKRGTTNEISGLPNITALREAMERADGYLVVAKIQNFAEISAALSPQLEKEVAEQIATRLAFGSSGATLYQGDDGLFAWSPPEDDMTLIADQLNALHAIFRSPISVSDRRIDVNIAFGIEGDTARSFSSRLASAVLAAQEAYREGDKWRLYDPGNKEDAEWKLSLLSELDAAIDTGEVWVAFQPQLDLRSGEIIGAEALVRWSHPIKGQISPEEFVVAAEKNNRIEKLTAHVLDRALAACAGFAKRGHDCSMSVNLSPRLLGHDGLARHIRQTLDKYELPVEKLTLEITETAAMSTSDRSVEELARLRDYGLNLAIDDYGTGFSTLEYLRKCPANELKIDKGFIQRLALSPSDRIMVNSTIELAHSLNQVVVAEGVEDEATLELLKQIGCDRVQGYLIGRPMDYQHFLRFILKHEKSTAA